MNSILSKFKLIYYFFRVVLFPRDLKTLFRMADFVMRKAPEDLFDSVLKKDPYLRDLTKRRYLGHFPGKSTSKHEFRKGTLGYCYLEMLEEKKITPYSDFTDRVDCSTNNQYLKERVRYLRDVLRLLLNLDISFEDEAALNSFIFAQIPSPIAGLVVGGIMFRAAVTDPMSLKRIFQKVSQAYRGGESSRNFLSIQWENMWDMPLDEARNQLVPNPAERISDRPLYMSVL